MEPLSKPLEIQLKRSGSKTRTHLPAGRDLEDRGADLIQVEMRMWSSLAQETRREQLQTYDERYHDIVSELYNAANLCVVRYQSFSRAHGRWRYTLIVGTGVLALLNVIAAGRLDVDSIVGKAAVHWSNLFATGAAVFAIILAILANLESFSNSLEKAQGYRESREMFLDVAREFDRRWDIYVRPLTDSPEACANATELYRQLAVKDRELRAKFKEMTKVESRTPRR